jgi:Rrf2 family protein
MLMFPVRYAFAIEAVVLLAGSARDRPLNAKRLSEGLGISLRYLEPTLQSLVRSGILQSTRGPRGGYRTLFDQSVLTLSDIVKAVAGEEEDARLVRGAASLSVTPILLEAEQSFLGTLAAWTVVDLLRSRRAAAA